MAYFGQKFGTGEKDDPMLVDSDPDEDHSGMQEGRPPSKPTHQQGAENVVIETSANDNDAVLANESPEAWVTQTVPKCPEANLNSPAVDKGKERPWSSKGDSVTHRAMPQSETSNNTVGPSSLNMSQFLEPSETILDQVQEKAGFIFSVQQRKSLKDHQKWTSVIKIIASLPSSTPLNLSGKYHGVDINELLKEFQIQDREQVISAVTETRRMILPGRAKSQILDKTPNLSPKATSRKTATSNGSRVIRRSSAIDTSPLIERDTSAARSVDSVIRTLDSFNADEQRLPVKQSPFQNQQSSTNGVKIANAKPNTSFLPHLPESPTMVSTRRTTRPEDLLTPRDLEARKSNPVLLHFRDRSPQPPSDVFPGDHRPDHAMQQITAGDDEDRERSDPTSFQVDENSIERGVEKSFEQAREDHEYGVSNLLRQQKAAVRPYIAKEYRLSPNAFALAKARTHPTGSQPDSTNAVRLVLEPVSTKGKLSTKRDHVRQTVEPTIYYDKPIQLVPGYSHYVSLKENILCENVVQLTYFPFRGDENFMSNDKYEIELNSRYDFNPRVGQVEIERIAQAQQALPYAEELMDSITVSYEAVLEYLLSPDDPFASYDLPLPRDSSCTEDFDRESHKWSHVYSGVRGNDERELYCAALLCAYWKSIWGWSLWHIAKTSISVDRVLQNFRRKAPKPESLRHMICCVCLLVDCNSHGEILEYIDQDDEEEFEKVRETTRDKEHRYAGVNGIVPTSAKIRLPWHLENINGINHRKYMVSLPRPAGEQIPTEFPRKIPTLSWRRNQESWDHDRRDPFYPCNHIGLCEDVKCSCWVKRIPCEKACSCPGECDRRISGCKCAQKGRPCSNRDICSCYALNRECDPELCGRCGAKEVLLDKSDINLGKCNNIMILRNIPRKTHLGTSTIHGLGLYMGEDIQAGEYIGEYKGEIITKAEADRRALIYDQRGTSYLFALNKKQDVDAMHKGNKMRFLNHSNDRLIKNVHPKVMLVNMVQRIGMFASREIKAGEELFFDYGWEKDKTVGFKSHKKTLHGAAGAEEVAEGATTTSGSASTASTQALSSGKAFAVKSKEKTAKKQVRNNATKLNIVGNSKESIVNVFENEGEYQGHSADEEADVDMGIDEGQADSEDESYHGSDVEAESD